MSVFERPEWAKADEFLATCIFSAMVGLGLLAAFFKIGLSGLWFDELYTGWVVGTDGSFGAMAARALGDVVPPLYYFLVYPFVQVLGDSEIGLRLLSILCAVGAILLLVFGGRPFFSLRGRLFAGVMATGSSFWFLQAQNARCYAVLFLLGTALMLLSLRIAAGPSREKRLLSADVCGLLAVSFLGSFVHFYMMYESLAVLGVLSIYDARRRILFLIFAGALFLAVLLYVKLVIERFTYISTGSNWIQNDLAWYGMAFGEIFYFSLNRKAWLALGVCAMAAGWRLAGRRATSSAGANEPGNAALYGDRLSAWARVWLSPALALIGGVPLIVLAGGISSSILLSPNFTSRNFLVCSPFLWGMAARLYDVGVAKAPRPLRVAANLALSLLALWMCITTALARSQFHGETFREAAAWIKNADACRGRVLPVIVPEHKTWFRSDRMEPVYEGIYGKYLDGFAKPRVVFLDDIMAHTLSAELKADLQHRVDDGGCPVLAWAEHGATPEQFDALIPDFKRAIDRPAAAIISKTFRDGKRESVFYVERPGKD